MTEGNPPPPILAHKNSASPSVFAPENLLREARRQKSLADGTVPQVCILDPDGDIVRSLVAGGRARRDPDWACYHTDLYRFTYEGQEFGIIGCAVGAAFAVLLAEQLFVSGCRLLLSMTSAGQIAPAGEPPYFVLIERALRDEGTSYHYLPPAEFSDADRGLIDDTQAALQALPFAVARGATWTTDAPFRETADAIDAHTARGLLAVEMEAAALYAFARARNKPVVCFAHVTNQMAQIEGDFEKGAVDGADASLQLLAATAQTLVPRPAP
jgi:uridine phosphorylase